MQEILIVLSDLYLSADADAERQDFALPGLEQAVRLGRRTSLPQGWRSWLLRWLEDDDQLSSVIAAARNQAGPMTRESRATEVLKVEARGAAVDAAPAAIALRALTHRAHLGRESRAPPASVWMATPVHLVTGMTSLHLDRRGLLHLEAGEARRLAQHFATLFADSDFTLEPLPSGDFLLFGPAASGVHTREPARCVGMDITRALPTGEGAALLRRLSGELEMWLHEHEVNQARSSRGERPVTALWIWGGAAVSPDEAPPSPESGDLATRADTRATALIREADRIGAFGDDAFLNGLWVDRPECVRSLPPHLGELFGYAHLQRAVLVIELSARLQSHPEYTLREAMQEIDLNFVAPAVQALREQRIEQVRILANDHLLTLRNSHRWMLWRRVKPGLSGLL